MSTRNDITGDSIQTKTSTEAYRSNWGRIFSNKEEKKDAEYKYGFDLYRCKIKEKFVDDSLKCPSYYERELKAEEGRSPEFIRGALEGIRVGFLEI